MVPAGWSLLDSSLAGSARPGRVDAREDHTGAGRALLHLPAAGTETGWGAGGSAPARPGARRAPQGCTSVSGPPPGLSLSVRPDVCVRFPGPPPCQPTEPALGLGRPRLPSWGAGWLTHLLQGSRQASRGWQPGAHHTESGLFEGRHGAVREAVSSGLCRRAGVRSSRVPTGSLAGGPGCWGHALSLRPALPATWLCVPPPQPPAWALGSLATCPWLPRSSWDRRRSSGQLDQEPVLPGLQETAGLRSRGEGRAENSFPGRRRLELCGEQLQPPEHRPRPTRAGRRPRSPCSELGLSQERVCVWGGGRTTQIDTQPLQGEGRHTLGSGQANRSRAEGHPGLPRGTELTLHLPSEKISVCTTHALYPRRQRLVRQA